MKVLKYVLLAVGGVVALVLLALAVVVAIFDPNRYKPEITAAVKDKTGRTLAIEGNLRLTVCPSATAAGSSPASTRPECRSRSCRCFPGRWWSTASRSRG